MPREHVRVRVIDNQFCIDRNCRACLSSFISGEVDCNRADCDNHLRDHEDEVAPMPLHKMPKMPPVGSIFE